MSVNTSEWQTAGDAAKVIGVTPDTVRLYERTGKLEALRTTGGVRLFRREDVEQLRHQREAARAVTGGGAATT